MYSFWKQHSTIDLTPQYPIPSPYPDYPYRVDFCHPGTKTVIELDGKAYHFSPEQKMKDAIRQSNIEQQGYVVISFTGKQINKNVVKCVFQARRLIYNRL